MPQIRFLNVLRVETSIISIDSNITDNIIRKVIKLLLEKYRIKNLPLRNTSINWIILWRLPIQTHPKPSITKKRIKKPSYLTWNFKRRKTVKKTSMPNPVKSFRYIKSYSSSSPRPVKIPSNSIKYNCQNISSLLRRRKTILEIRKNAKFLLVINNPIIYKSSKDFTNHRK